MAQEKSKVWYKEPWPWLLFSGPAIVVVAAFVTLYLAASGSSDLVSDDYYKDGKHIDLDLKRDTAAVERGIRGQALINPDGSAVRVYVSGRFVDKVPLKLTLLHPVKKEYDQSIGLKLSTARTVRQAAAGQPLVCAAGRRRRDLAGGKQMDCQPGRID